MKTIESVSYERKKSVWEKKTPEQRRAIYDSMITKSKDKRVNYLKCMYVVMKNDEGKEELKTAHEAEITHIKRKKKGSTLIEYKNVFVLNYRHSTLRLEILLRNLIKFKIKFSSKLYRESNILEITVPELHPDNLKINVPENEISKRLKKNIKYFPDMRGVLLDMGV